MDLELQVYTWEKLQIRPWLCKRNDIIKLYPEISYTIWPEKSKFLNHRFELTPVFILKPGLNNEISDYYIISKLDTYGKNSG